MYLITHTEITMQRRESIVCVMVSAGDSPSRPAGCDILILSTKTRTWQTRFCKIVAKPS